MTATDFEAWIDSPGSDVLHLADTVTLSGISNKTYDGRWREVWWDGPADKSAFLCDYTSYVEFNRMRIIPKANGISCFDVAAKGDCRWTDITIDWQQVGSFDYGWRVDHSILGHPDANNDRHLWTECLMSRANKAFWYFDGGQSMLHTLTGCGGWGLGVTKHCIQSVVTHTIKVVGGGGSTMADYVYQFGQDGAGLGAILGPVWEVCYGGLFAIPGELLTPVGVPIRDCRYNQAGIVKNPTIAIGAQVPYMEITNNDFESDGDAAGLSSPCRIEVRSGVGGGGVSIRFNRFMQWVPTPPVIAVGKLVLDCDVFGNSWFNRQVFKGRVIATRTP